MIFFPGHVVKNRDCPGKSGMDGHLITAHLVTKFVFFSDIAIFVLKRDVKLQLTN